MDAPSRSPLRARAAAWFPLAAGLLVGCGGAAAGPPRPACPEGTAGATVARARFLMGTRLSIEIPAPVREEVFEAAFDEVARLEMVMSNWDESSEISRLNRAAAAPFRCSPDLFAAVAAALGWAERTGGAFDPTVEPLVRDLGLRGPEGRLPGAVGPGVAASASRAGRHPAAPIGWRHVRLSQGDRTVRFDAPGVGVDLGGIGKGIALDAAAAVLARSGVNAALLDFGGQVLALGPPPGRRGWTVGIADPADRERAVGAVVLRDASLASSGNGERGTGAAGAGHILDPLRRAPARFGGTVTVRAADAASADALSTALFVMGPEEGRAWAGAHGIAALYLWRRPDGGLERRETGPLGDERN